MNKKTKKNNKDLEKKIREENSRIRNKMCNLIIIIFIVLVVLLVLFFKNDTDNDYVIYDVFSEGKYKVVSKLNHLEIIDENKKALIKYNDIDTSKIKYNKEQSTLIDDVIYIVFSDIDEKKCYEYEFNSITNESKTDEFDCVPEFSYSYTVKKPIIYFYPKSKENVTVKLEHPEYLTTTYPKYENGWFVKAYPDGSLYDASNKYYYALYYEEENNRKISFDEGFVVKKDEAYKFLEDKLSIIGLNNKERNEMIMYWLPVLEENEKSLVYFEFTEEREKNNKLIINPTPDSLLRVSMHIKKISDDIVVKEESLIGFERDGFTVVEWGGVIHK